jgi:hypothetical protein
VAAHDVRFPFVQAPLGHHHAMGPHCITKSTASSRVPTVGYMHQLNPQLQLCCSSFIAGVLRCPCSPQMTRDASTYSNMNGLWEFQLGSGFGEPVPFGETASLGYGAVIS